MSANRGKFVSNIAALRPTDALATPGRSVAVFFGAGFVSWALSALRGLFPSRGRAFLRARRAERWGGNVCKSRKVCQQYRGFATGTDAPATTGRSVDGFEGVFASWALSASRGLFPSRGRAFLRGDARSGVGCWQGRRNGRGGNVCKSRKVCQQYRGFATGADAPATTGRSAAGFFEAVFASWALSASRGLSPSRGGPFCVAAREAWWDGGGRECLQAEESLSAVSRLCDRRMLSQRPAGLPTVFSRPFLRRVLCPRPGACPLRGGGLFCVAAREAGRDVGKAGRTAGDRPVCVAARGNCDNFRINRLYFTFSANIYMCFTVLCHERQSLRIYCFMSIGDNDTDIWRERS